MINGNNENITNDEVKDATMKIIHGAPLDPIIMLCDPLKTYWLLYVNTCEYLIRRQNLIDTQSYQKLATKFPDECILKHTFEFLPLH